MTMTHRFMPAVLAVSLLVAACGDEGTGPRQLSGAAARIYGGECAKGTGREVTIYSGRSENLIEPVLDAFACKTGIAVSVRWGSSTELALLIGEEGDRTLADVFISRSPGPIGFLESRGLLQQINTAVSDLVPAQHRSQEGTWVGFSGRKRVLVYNIDQLGSDQLPDSVFGLTGEEWRGKVAIPATNGSFIDWFTVFRDQYGAGAARWLDDMVANDARYYPNNRSIVEAVGRGEIEAGLVNHYYNFQEAAAGGDDHRALNHDLADEDIGSLLIITAATVTAASDRTEEAEALIRYLLAEPVQTYFTEETFEYPLAAGVDPVDALPALAALEIGSVDFDSLGDGFEETTEIIETSGILDQ